MEIALIGFSKSGKTTVYNALTGASAEVSAYSTGKAKTHRSTVKVPDLRLDKLYDLYQSKKLTHATIDYVDPIGIRRDEAGEGVSLGEDMLHTIATADALAAVIRFFEDESGVVCDPEGDFDAITLELILSDLKKVDNRLERIENQAQRVGGEQRKALQDEARVLQRLKEALEDGRPIRTLEFTPDEDKTLRSFQFLTTKPLIAVLNTGEDRAEQAQELTGQLKAMAAEGEGQAAGARFLTLNGQTEMEIAQLDAEERNDFLEEFGIEMPGADRMIRICYDALGLISFFTVGPDETRAWTIPEGTAAAQAAGAIHSDLERGFIRAQVIRWDELLKLGSIAEAKKQGALRTEGKDYTVQDGDVIEVMFSV